MFVLCKADAIESRTRVNHAVKCLFRTK